MIETEYRRHRVSAGRQRRVWGSIGRMDKGECVAACTSWTKGNHIIGYGSFNRQAADRA